MLLNGQENNSLKQIAIDVMEIDNWRDTSNTDKNLLYTQYLSKSEHLTNLLQKQRVTFHGIKLKGRLRKKVFQGGPGTGTAF
jgi:kynurenine formamidase